MLDLLAPETRRDPYPLYALMRARSPVLHVPAAGFWMLFGYEGVRRALTDHDAFSSSMVVAGRANPDWLIFMDPARHTKLRGLITRAFTSRSIAGLEPRVRELTRELLDPAVERGEIDLATELAVPLPLMVIAEMLGLPAEDWPLHSRWSDVILALSHTVSGGAEAAQASAGFATVTEEMRHYVADLLRRRRGAPRDDLLTRLAESEVDGARLTDEEILGFVQLLLVAGHETTTNLITNTMLTLAEHPASLATLRARPELLPSAIEEVLRFRSPVQWMFRATRREVEVQGATIPAGQLVLPVIGSANRDAAHVADADRFDIERAPQSHIAFGHGIHFCLGAPLARLETRVVFENLLRVAPGVELASRQPWTPRAALHVLGPARLPVRFVPGGSAAVAT